MIFFPIRKVVAFRTEAVVIETPVLRNIVILVGLLFGAVPIAAFAQSSEPIAGYRRGFPMNGMWRHRTRSASIPRRLSGRVLIALDGTEHFCSRKIHCPRCSTRKRSDGGTEYFHAFLGASIVASGHQQVLPLPPAFIAPQDGAEKQDCERNAAKRWLIHNGSAVKHLRPVYLGDDLFACQPIAAAIQAAGGNFILTCKPSSHRTISEYLYGATLEEHRTSTVRPGKGRVTTIYRWLSSVPLRATDDALKVNWFSIEIQNAKGKRTFFNSCVTDLEITNATVAEIAACGRARWKIENETFNVLKTNGYNLEHNFGHGKETLASVLVTLNLLAFGFHTAARLAVLAWRQAVIARGPTYRFFEHLRMITVYIVFEDWDHLLRSIAAAACGRPEPRAGPSTVPPTRHKELNHEKKITRTSFETAVPGGSGNQSLLD